MRVLQEVSKLDNTWYIKHDIHLLSSPLPWPPEWVLYLWRPEEAAVLELEVW